MKLFGQKLEYVTVRNVQMYVYAILFLVTVSMQ